MNGCTYPSYPILSTNVGTAKCIENIVFLVSKSMKNCVGFLCQSTQLQNFKILLFPYLVRWRYFGIGMIGVILWYVRVMLVLGQMELCWYWVRENDVGTWSDRVPLYLAKEFVDISSDRVLLYFARWFCWYLVRQSSDVFGQIILLVFGQKCSAIFGQIIFLVFGQTEFCYIWPDGFVDIWSDRVLLYFARWFCWYLVRQSSAYIWPDSFICIWSDRVDGV